MTHEERKDKLSPLMERFVQEYVQDPSDGGAAYLRANKNCTTKKSASVQSSKLLKLPKIQKALEEVAKDALGSRKVAILKNIDFWLDIRDDTSNRPADRMKASENLGKYMQMFVEKKEVDITAQVKIVDNI